MLADGPWEKPRWDGPCAAPSLINAVYCVERMRICLIYDCLYPHTVGGAERWYRGLAERLAEEGHEVTYLTLRQWPRGEQAQIDPRVRVVVAGPRMALYTSGGRRRIAPPLLFGAGVLWHLLRHGRRYEVVHTCSFPYFSLLAAALVRPLRRYGLVVDWFEVWSRSYWRDYLGGAAGLVGAAVQRACARVPQRAFCFSQLHAKRLREEGMRGGDATVLTGLYAGSPPPVVPPEVDPSVPDAGGSDRASLIESAPSAPDTQAPDTEAPDPGSSTAAGPLVLFAGRLIPEKRVGLGVAAVALAAARVPQLRAVFYGDGPEREALHAAVAAHGVRAIVATPGFAPAQDLEADMRRAACMLVTSSREGYGLVVVEASAHGTPSIVVAGEDNAATELVEDGVNGVLVAEDTPEAIAEAIVRVCEDGPALRGSTARWYAANAERLSLEHSLRAVLASYAGGAGRSQDAGTASSPSARA
jgi:glycosyltransferase involved in cell wall biosynthesis